jgi:hypothetical protein
MLNVGEQLGKIFIVKASGSVEEEESPPLCSTKSCNLKTVSNCRQSENYLKLQTI